MPYKDRDKRLQCQKRHYEKHREKISQKNIEKCEDLQRQIFEIIPNRCYYQNRFCFGRLEWDHRYGDGRYDPSVGRRGQLARIIRNPERWLRLCSFHNYRKSNTSKEIHEADILDIAEQIKRRLTIPRMP